MSGRLWPRAAAALLTAGSALSPSPARAQLKSEELTTVELPAAPKPRWVWVNEVSFTRMLDGRAYLIDADSGQMLGMVSGGYSHPFLQISPPGDRVLVPATFYSRGTRGERTDVLTYYDVKNLAPVAEVGLPPKRYSGLPFIGTMAMTDDGRYSLIYNFTPEQSITVVDIAGRRVVGEFATPGCGLVYPVGPTRFLMQCSDGAMQYGEIGPQGTITPGAVSPKLFADSDPASEKPVRTGEHEWLFFTPSGEVHVIDGSGKAPSRRTRWRLAERPDTKGWRIGGLQPAAYHRPSGELFVLMHQGGGYTHKDPGTEVWVFDAAKKALLRRLKLEGTATSIAVSPDASPLLYTVMAGRDDLRIYDGKSGAKLRSVGGLGHSLSYLQPATGER